jgi:hypothetical protein
LGHRCSYEGRSPDEEKKAKILDWPACTTETEVRGFLGTAGVLRIFLPNYSKLSRPLVDLTRKDTPFHWGEAQQRSMDAIKEAIRNAPCLAPIDYESEGEVILGVDSSEIGVGWFIAQRQADGTLRYCRFGSATFSDVVGRYGQSKIELFGLYTALIAARFYIFGVKRLVVEVDAKYLKGMVNNPDRIPDAATNRWIAGIRLFQFEWRHIPGKAHAVADGLSRRRQAENDQAEDPEAKEEWLDKTYGFYTNVLLADAAPQQARVLSPRAAQSEERLTLVREVLASPDAPMARSRLSAKEWPSFQQFASRFLLKGGQLFRRKGPQPDSSERLVPQRERREELVRQIHDELGHKGVYAVYQTLAR